MMSTASVTSPVRSRPIRIAAVLAVLAALSTVVLATGDDSTRVRAGDPAADAAPAIGQARLIRGEPAMTNAQAVVLGLVEGITEYLPVSSTGHLLIAERAMNLDADPTRKDALDTYTVVIQIGAILAVLALYRRRVGTIVLGLAGRSDDGRRLLAALIVAFLPAAVIGVAGESLISDRLLRPGPVVIAWIIGGVVLLAVWRTIAMRPPAVTDLTVMGWQRALAIGAMQAVALWPGTSRSFVTILGALLVGLSLEAAVEFSFLLGLITLSAATGFALLRDGGALFDLYGFRAPLIGIVVAGLSAWAAVRWMVGFLNSRGLAPFGWYRIAAGVVVGALLATGAL
jgi:undecaprenyl-diphosphatase